MIDLSISIVNTNNWHYLDPCLRSIIDNTHMIKYEILVVDNASTDGSTEKIQEYYPEVILSINQKRFGFAKNNNINLKKSRGRYLMLLNDDTLVQPDSLAKAVKYMDENLEIGMIGCKMVSPDGTVQQASARRLPTLTSMLWKELGLSYRFYKSRVFSPYLIDDQDYSSIKKIEFPSEAGLIIRKSIVNEIGLLDEQFFMYGEGADWARRMKKSGYKAVFFPECPITHFGNVTNQRSGNLKLYEQYYKSTYLYFRKESFLCGLIYQLLVTSIFSLKILIFFMIYILSMRRYKPYPDVFAFYWASIRLMIFKLPDINYPFPLN
jgi:GT2 family glycosyltransferase